MPRSRPRPATDHAGGNDPGRRRRPTASAGAPTGTESGLGWRGWTLGSLTLALVARLITGPLSLNYYDIGYALVWGRELLDGHLPNYRTPGASTPHPLATLLATIAAAFGTPDSWYIVEAIIFVSLGVAGSALYALTRTCVARALADRRGASAEAAVAGVIAVGALVLNPTFLTDALNASGLSDVPALALVLAAGALAAEHSGRVHAPLVLLGLAGLMRPEAWGLAAAYWLYLAGRRSPRRDLVEAAGLVLAAPLLWALCDAAVVGDPTYSLTYTQASAQFFAHGLGQVPRTVAKDLRGLVGVPVLLLGTLGALGALAGSRRATAPALGLLALGLAEFAGLGLAGEPLLERFLLIVAAMVCLFFAYAVTAGRDQLLALTGGGRPWLRPAAALAATVLLVYLGASHLAYDLDLRSGLRAAVNAEADLASISHRPEVRAALRKCPGFYLPSFTLTSLVADDFDFAPETLRPETATPPRRGLILVPTTTAAAGSFGVTPAGLRVLRQFTLVSLRVLSQNRSWRLYAGSTEGSCA